MKESDSRVLLSFGEHTERSIPRIKELELRIRQKLNMDPTLKVVFLGESADLTAEDVKDYERDVKSGILPSKASQRISRRLSIKNNRHVAVDDFELAQIELEDNLFTSYPGRILTTREFSADHVRSQGNDFITSLDISYHLARTGNFDEALGHFKSYVHGLTKNSADREKQVADRVANLARRENTLVVVRFGEGHSDIYWMLKKRGINAERYFDESENGTVKFTPPRVLERKLRYKSYEPTQLEWMQWMVAQLIFVVEYAKTPDNRNSAVRNTFKRMESFKTIKQIRELEQSLRKPKSRFKLGPIKF